MAIFLPKIEIAELCKGVHCVDLEESFQMSVYYLLAKIGVDAAERIRPVKFAERAERVRFAQWRQRAFCVLR